MTEEFRISTAMTKAELIEQHQRLLDAFQAKAKESEEARRKRAEAERQLESQAVRVAREATVAGVIEQLGALRGLLGKTLNDLTDKMTAQAERLESLNRAIQLQETRLKELHDIEAAADSLAALATAYEERRATTEADLSARVVALEEEQRVKERAFEEQFTGRKLSLELEVQEARKRWEEERIAAEREQAEYQANLHKIRQREEAEYLYSRDRNRRIEEHQYQEKVAALGREFEERSAARDRALAERETAVAAREAELAELNRQVAEFPKTLERELERVRKEASTATAKDAQQRAELQSVQFQWEKRMLEERIAHLQEGVQSREEKLAELKTELGQALKQVQQIAEKTVEGASLTKAFQTVNQIALEQARRSDPRPTE